MLIELFSFDVNTKSPLILDPSKEAWLKKVAWLEEHRLYYPSIMGSTPSFGISV